MQPIAIFVASAVAFAIAFWVVRGVLISIFRTQALNPLGVALIATALLLFLLRNALVAIALLIIGSLLLLRKNGAAAGGPEAQTSKVSSAHLEMTLDHATGTINGRILTGKRQDQFLSDLTLNDLMEYHAEIQMDEQTLQLLETFLDAAHADWRDQEDTNSARDEEMPPSSTRLSRDQAYRLLGLEAGCSDDDIRRAYHRLIKRVHPDSGGSAVLTAQITAARDRLLGDRQ